MNCLNSEKSKAVIVIGMSGAGKSMLLAALTMDPRFVVMHRWTTRTRRKDDDESISCVLGLPMDRILFVYEGWGETLYGVDVNEALNAINQGNFPVIELGDLDVAMKLKIRLGSAIIVEVVREMDLDSFREVLEQRKMSLEDLNFRLKTFDEDRADALTIKIGVDVRLNNNGCKHDFIQTALKVLKLNCQGVVG